MLLLIGLVIGLVLALTGAGGSVFAVPLLIFTGISLSDAVGVSLGAVAASTFYGSVRNWRSNTILWIPGIILAVSGIITAPLGKWLGTQIPELFLLISFNLLALIIAMRMWLSAVKSPDHAKVVRATPFSQGPAPELLCNLSKTGHFELRLPCVSGLIIGGALVGLLSGLFGVGGGFLIIPLLLALSPIGIARAVSTSILIITMISSSGFISHLFISPSVNIIQLGLVAAGGILGMIAGQLVSQKLAGAALQKIFAVSLMIISITTSVIYLVR